MDGSMRLRDEQRKLMRSGAGRCRRGRRRRMDYRRPAFEARRWWLVSFRNRAARAVSSGRRKTSGGCAATVNGTVAYRVLTAQRGAAIIGNLTVRK